MFVFFKHFEQHADEDSSPVFSGEVKRFVLANET